MKNLSIEEILEAKEIINKRMELKSKIGHCPPPEFRVKANCFYCDECWLSSLELMEKGVVK